jgi:hypothetical protein
MGHRNIAHTVRYAELSPNRLGTSGGTDRGGGSDWRAAASAEAKGWLTFTAGDLGSGCLGGG